MCAGAGTFVSSRFSVNTSNHSGRSRNRSSEARLLSLFYFCFEFLVNRAIFLGAGSSLRSVAGLEDELDESCGGGEKRTCWYHNLSTIPGQQGVRNFPSCRESSSLVWSGEAFDRWPTQSFSSVLRRALQVMELQACHRVFAPSQRDQDRTRTLVLPHPHWSFQPLWSSWIPAESPFRLSFNSFFFAQHVHDAPESTTKSRLQSESKAELYLYF